jgi:hypothetical protein
MKSQRTRNVSSRKPLRYTSHWLESTFLAVEVSEFEDMLGDDPDALDPDALFRDEDGGPKTNFNDLATLLPPPLGPRYYRIGKRERYPHFEIEYGYTERFGDICIAHCCDELMS